MKTWIKPALMAALFCILAGCAAGPYREEFNWTAVFQAYTHYHLLADHPFDDGDAPPDDGALRAALVSALQGRGLIAAARDEERARQVVLALSYDIQAGRRRIQIIAANQVATWAYQMKKRSDDPDLIAVEMYERQTGSLIYRAEAKRQDTPEETVLALLSGYPPRTYLYRQAAEQRAGAGL